MGAGALAAYMAVRWLQSPGRAAEVVDVHVAARAHGGAAQPGMGTDAAGLEAELLHVADASMRPGSSWAAGGHSGAPGSTMGSAAMLSTAEILQSVADQQACAVHALGGCVPGSAASSRQQQAMPGAAATRGDMQFSDALPSRLGSVDLLGAASVREQPSRGPLAVLFRLSMDALRL